jgi:hypothetical protein
MKPDKSWRRKGEREFTCMLILSFVRVYETITSEIMRGLFVSDTMSYIEMRDYWCDILIWRSFFQQKIEIDDVKGSFYEELEHVRIFKCQCI